MDQAMEYAHSLLNSITDGQDKIAALTALMVVVNTASKLWPEADAQVASGPATWTREELVSLVRSEINEWSSDTFDARADEWLNDHADLDHEIERWAENNLDIENEVQDVLRSASLRINF
jgi:hypothetical protein